MDCVEIALPLRTISEGNSAEHWSKKHKRHKKQKQIIRLYLNRLPKGHIYPPVKITLTRIAPRMLDVHDNLPMSFKWVLDAICDYLYPGQAAGRADSSKDIHVFYDQQKGRPKEYSILIKIENI